MHTLCTLCVNLRDTRIFDYVYDEHGNKKAVFNAKETTAAQAKQEVIKQAFQYWIWKDPFWFLFADLSFPLLSNIMKRILSSPKV